VPVRTACRAADVDKKAVPNAARCAALSAGSFLVWTGYYV
jgi:hypothetical protein